MATRTCKTPDMVDIGSFASWLFAAIGEWAVGRALGQIWGKARRSEQLSTLMAAVKAAVDRTAREVRPDASEEAVEHLAAVLNQVVDPRLPAAPLANYPTLLQALEAGIAAQIGVLDDPDLTGRGQSSLQLLGLRAEQLAKSLTRNVVSVIIERSRLSGGAALTPLAEQFNHDVTHGKLDQLAKDVKAIIDTLQDLPASKPTIPHQLEPEAADFTGRADELRRLRGWLAAAATGDPVGASQGRPGAIITISGMAGVGKSALATYVAHRVKDQFPDGQLHLNLKGSSPGQPPMGPNRALRHLLESLGEPPDRVPDDPDDVDLAAARWRSLSASRRLLVLLDNAATAAQLLPASATCAVLVTSRDVLATLSGARPLPLEELPSKDAAELLTKLVGENRVAADPDAATEIVRLCGYLPLAIDITGRTLPAYGDLAELRDRLQDRRARLDPIRTALRVSYDVLDPLDQRLLRCLALPNVPDFTAWMVAALLDLSADTAKARLDHLVRVSLVRVRADRDARGLVRYDLHDRVREFAGELLDQDAPEASVDRRWARSQALTRMLVAYHGCVNYAFHLINRDNPMVDARDLPVWGQGYPAAKVAVDGGSQPAGKDEDEQAMRQRLAKRARDWFAAEQANVVALVKQAAEAVPPPAMTARLAYSLFHLLEGRGHRGDWQHMDEIALRIARTTADRHAEARALRNQGRYAMVGVLDQAQQLEGTLLDPPPPQQFPGRCAEAIELLEQARTLYRQVGDRNGEAVCVRELADCHELEGEFPAAIRDYELAKEAFAGVAGEDTAVGSLLIGLGRARQGHGHQLQARKPLGAAKESFAQAEACFEKGVEYGHRLAHHRLEAYGLRHLAGLYRDCYDPQRFEDALARYDQSLRAFESARDPRGEVRTRAERARLLAHMGEYAQATDVLRSVRNDLAAWQETEWESPDEVAMIEGWLAELAALTARQADG
jgi:tetratricopeptide (TPR) repeat protein